MKRILLVCALAAVAFAQAPEHPAAQSAGTGNPNKATVKEVENAPINETNDLMWQFVNFALLALGLGYLSVKHGGPYFRNRADAIRNGIAEASKVKADAEARAAEIERRIANLSADVEDVRKHAASEMQAEGERIRTETANEISKIQARAEQEIATAAKLASHELKVYSAQLALDLAEQQIRGRMDAPTGDALVQRFVNDIDHKEKAAVS